MKNEPDLRGLSALLFFAKRASEPFVEIFYGIVTNTLPWLSCTLASLVLAVLVGVRADILLFEKLSIDLIYPYWEYLYWPYAFSIILMPFVIWGMSRVYLKRKLITRLTEVFVNAGLKTKLGKLPGFISDKPIDECTRKLQLTSRGLPLNAFESAQESLESSLQVYIDEIRQNIENGLIEIIYAHKPMPTFIKFPEISQFRNFQYAVGYNRSSMLKCSFKEHPHLLVAGETGGGKSTFLRGLLTSIYANHKNRKFTLVDLKGGLEFQIFEGLPGVKIAPDISSAIPFLRNMKQLMDRRMEFLKKANCRELDDYFKLPDHKKVKSEKGFIDLDRQIIAVDEAADLFLAGPEVEASQAQEARRCLSSIARKGRACGIHLIIGTQRPDVKSLDPQIKANLTAVVCFQMQNNATSITAIDSGRASDLPDVKGRAILKLGGHLTEVQTPFMDVAEALEILEPFKKEKSDSKKESSSSKPNQIETQVANGDTSAEIGE